MAPSSPPKRPSKFIEALPHFDGEEDPSASTATATPANKLFYSILHEMDDYELRQRQRSRERGSSQSSLDSLPSANGSTRIPSFLQSTDHQPLHTVVKEGRRSINFTRTSLDQELGSSGSSDGENAGDKLARKFVGRLRALTGGTARKDGEMKGVSYRPGS